jgi:hypothetical protein
MDFTVLMELRRLLPSLLAGDFDDNRIFDDLRFLGSLLLWSLPSAPL